MGKSTKTQHLREKMRAAAKQSKQQTLDSLQDAPQKEPDRAVDSDQKKHIVITEIGTQTKEDELALKVAFRLLPSKTAFSKVKSDLWFDGQKISSVTVGIPQSPLATNDFELTPVLNMKGISAGSHAIKAEMCELWAENEKSTSTSKEVTIEICSNEKRRQTNQSPNRQKRSRNRHSYSFRLREKHLPRNRRRHEKRSRQQTRQILEMRDQEPLDLSYHCYSQKEYVETLERN